MTTTATVQPRRHHPLVAIGRRAPLYLTLLMGTVIFIYPFLWMIATSLRTPQEVARAGLSLWVTEPQWDNFARALSTFPVATYAINSVLTTAIPLAFTVTVSSLVGFAFARLRVPGSGIAFAVVLGTMLLPGEVTIVPQFVLFRAFGMIDTLYPLIIPNLFGSAFAIFLFRQYYLRFPESLVEAARLDGCGYFGIWSRIFVPMSKPAFAATGVIFFMSFWNNFIGPLIFINSDRWKTLPLALAGFQSTYSTQVNLLMACTLLVLLPCILLFFFAQRAFLEGTAIGGEK